MDFLSLYWWRLLVSLVVSYLIGSFSFAVIFSKHSKEGKDVREMGSGNAGFTNVLRTVGVGPAVLTFIFDWLKGVIAILLTIFIFNLQVDSSAINALTEGLQKEYLDYGKYLSGLFCIIGHCFPVFFGFRGGKGITTTAGVLFMFDIRILLISFAFWLIAFFVTKIISVAAMAAAVNIIIWNFVVTYFWKYKKLLGTDTELRINYVWVTTAIILVFSIFIVIMHRENIKRLLRGEEKKITVKKKTS
ncbi:MAG: glycerol-3-phosphate 1-O-acyltransferase PlsY [Ruminococcus sp.]|nr:glycerol-3-phosphate 1-O-acyltransferase PlsY [Ruminococcus sp.]